MATKFTNSSAHINPIVPHVRIGEVIDGAESVSFKTVEGHRIAQSDSWHEECH